MIKKSDTSNVQCNNFFDSMPAVIVEFILLYVLSYYLEAKYSGGYLERKRAFGLLKNKSDSLKLSPMKKSDDVESAHCD